MRIGTENTAVQSERKSRLDFVEGGCDEEVDSLCSND